MVELLRRCLTRDEAASDAGTGDLGAADVATLDAVLEAAAPEIGLVVLATCPYCGAEQQITVDPYLCLAQTGSELFGEIHALAMVYH